MTLKVTQGHWKWYCSAGHISLPLVFCIAKSSLSQVRIGWLLPVRPLHVMWVGSGSLKVDDADKGYTGGPKERERLC